MEVKIVRTTDVGNTNIGDLYLNAQGDVVLETSLAEEVAQRLFVRLNFWQAEWFLNLDEGTPYYQHILGKASNRMINSVFSQVVRGTEGVAELISLTFSVTNRQLRLIFKARLTDGTIFNSADFLPFVVSV